MFQDNFTDLPTFLLITFKTEKLYKTVCSNFTRRHDNIEKRTNNLIENISFNHTDIVHRNCA